MTQQQTHGTILDTVGRAKHSLADAVCGDTASVTVHGACPLGECRTMNIVDVRADTQSITCSGCGRAFDV
jgi:hypothetical protein